MRTLVTGGAGFIGSHLVDALVDRGHACTVLDDLSRGDRSNLAHHGDAVTFVHGSVTDRDLVHDVARDADAVLHLASVVGVRSTIADPTRVIDVSVRGTANVVDAAPTGAALLVASSSEIYGRSPEVPYDEQTPGVIGAPDVARWSYAHAKACSEHLALAAGRTRSRPPAVVRYFNVYGPRMPRTIDPSVVARFLDAARVGEPLRLHEGGRQTRNFVYVDDAVEATLAALELASGRVVNLGGPLESSISDLAHLITKVTGSSSEVVSVPDPASAAGAFEDPARRSATGALAASLLGWEPTTPLEDGLTRSWESWTAGLDELRPVTR